MRQSIFSKCCFFFTAAAVCAPAWAGSITGTVTFEGVAPEMKPIKMDADPHCAAMHKDNPPKNEFLVLGEGQTIANIFVRVIEGLPEGKTYPVPVEPIVLTQEGCNYAPRVFAAYPGQTVKILNPDAILHNVNGMPRKNTPFNRAMPGALQEIEVKFDKPEELFQIKCDIHPWMRAYCAVVDNPFYSITGKDGVYTIEGLEPGEYEIEAWQEKLGKQTAKVTVAEGAATHDFSFSRPAGGSKE